MPLPKYPSICELNQKIIVSQDPGERRKHIADNTELHTVSHYRIDGVVINSGERCDYLLLDEDRKTAYLIELKGSDVIKGINQLETTSRVLYAYLASYLIKYRLVVSRVNTHDLHQMGYMKFKRKFGDAFICKEKELREAL